MLTFFNKSGEGQLLNCCLLAQVGFDIKFQRYFIQDGKVVVEILGFNNKLGLKGPEITFPSLIGYTV